MHPLPHVARFGAPINGPKKPHAVQAAIQPDREARTMDGAIDAVDNYALSPMQPWMLFSVTRSGVATEQIIMAVCEPSTPVGE
ncbi:hypothetical protein [Mycobacterium sp. C31M]